MQPNTNSVLMCVCVCVCVFSACGWLDIYNDKTVGYSYSSHHAAATCIYAEQPLKRRTLGVSESIPDILSLLPLVVAISGMKLLCVNVCVRACMCVCVCVCARVCSHCAYSSVSLSFINAGVAGGLSLESKRAITPACV